MKILSFILNLPYTIVGLLLAFASLPIRVSFSSNPLALIVYTKTLWWTNVGYMKGARAAAFGHVVLLGPKTEDKDLKHELIHVEQHQRRPLLQPFFYYYEQLTNGSDMNNKYERAAYERAGNVYKGK